MGMQMHVWSYSVLAIQLFKALVKLQKVGVSQQCFCFCKNSGAQARTSYATLPSHCREKESQMISTDRL